MHVNEHAEHEEEGRHCVLRGTQIEEGTIEIRPRKAQHGGTVKEDVEFGTQLIQVCAAQSGRSTIPRSNIIVDYKGKTLCKIRVFIINRCSK